MVYTKVCSDGNIPTFSTELEHIIRQFDTCRGVHFAMSVGIANLLSYFLPKKRARQIAFLPYLLCRERKAKDLHARIVDIQSKRK